MGTSTLPFNPDDNRSVINYLENLDSSQLLENSIYIYTYGNTSKAGVLENVIRFGHLNEDELSDQRRNLQAVIRSICESGRKISKNHEKYLLEVNSLIEDRIYKLGKNSNKMDSSERMISVLESQVPAGYEFKYKKDRFEPVAVTESAALAKAMDKTEGITPRALLESVLYIAGNSSDSLNTNNLYWNNVKQRVCDMVKKETECDDCWDLPTLQSCKYAFDYAKDAYSDDECILSKLDELFTDLCDDLDDTIKDYSISFFAENGFNPNPFNIMNMTPFPVGYRTVNRVMTDIDNAETDEEVLESLVDIAKITYALESDQLTPVLEDNIVRKGIRAVHRGGDKISNKVGKVGKEVKDTVNDLKHATVTPIARYLNDQYDKMKAADKQDRREAIQHGRKDGTLHKIQRAVKKGILGLVGAGVVGSLAGGPIIGAILAGISLIVMYATDKNMDRKEKQKVILELEDELRIVEEKIEDSRNEEDRSKKYELLRIKNRLTREIARLKMGGDFNVYDDKNEKK